MKVCGIYSIKHSESGKVYIGQSRDLQRRFREYKSLNCKGQPKLFAALQKYGIGCFAIDVVQLCQPEHLDAFEEVYIRYYRAVETGYNIALKPVGVGQHSPETRAKMAASATGKRHTAETRTKMSLSRMGNKNGAGRKSSDYTKALISATSKGRKHSAETKAIISATHKNKFVSEETREKIAAANRGRIFSEEHKQKLKDAAQRRKQQEKEKKNEE